jgi:hypothetical protein
LKQVFKVVALVGMVLTAVTSLAQEREEREHPDPNDIRSFATLFGRSETRLASAIQTKKQPEVEMFLAPEFVIRTSFDPERTLFAKEWLQRIHSQIITDVQQRAMNIRAFKDVAIVSFVQSQRSRVAEANGDFLVTDVWIVNSGAWKLAQRYWARANRSK